MVLFSLFHRTSNFRARNDKMLGLFEFFSVKSKQFQECSGIFSIIRSATLNICSTIFFRHFYGRRSLERGRKTFANSSFPFVGSFCFADLRHLERSRIPHGIIVRSSAVNYVNRRLFVGLELE